MTLSMVEVVTERGDTLELPLQNMSDGYYIEEILGLDPVKAEIVSSSFGNVDGAQFQAARRESRNIVIKMGLSPDFVATSVRSLRLRLYSLLMPKSRVFLRFYMDDGVIAEIEGRVESFEAPLFVREPEATLSIICLNPDFYKTTSEVVNGTTVSTNVEQVINYEGSTPTGFVFNLAVNRTLSEVAIYHRGGDNSQAIIEFIGSLLAGDVLSVSTVSGNKYAKRIRAGSDTSMLYAVSPESSWIQLSPGVNNIRVYEAGAAVPFTLEYVNKYGGL